MIPDIEEPGCTWGHYIEHLVALHGGRAALVDLLIHRGSDVVDLPTDPQTIERAIRRLGTRGNGDGGKYGRWLIRYFGVPRPLIETARWMGQYHSRFSDLPTSLRYSQLLLWDRPPICETAASAWIQLGLASVAMRRRQLEQARAHVRKAQSSDLEVRAESLLLEARLASDTDEDVVTFLDQAEHCVSQLAESADYQARVIDQRAYQSLHSNEPDVEHAQSLYAAIAETTPFAAFRRHHGLAYCAWKRGDIAKAADHAREAASHAADGGLIRFRVQALRLLAHILGGVEAESLRSRARRMAESIEQLD